MIQILRIESLKNCMFIFCIREAMHNMGRTISDDLHLLKQHLHIEYNIVCEPARKIELEYYFPKFCPSLLDTNEVFIYCSLLKSYAYLDTLKQHLQSLLSYLCLQIFTLFIEFFILHTFLSSSILCFYLNEWIYFTIKYLALIFYNDVKYSRIIHWEKFTSGHVFFCLFYSLQILIWQIPMWTAHSLCPKTFQFCTTDG